MRPTLSKAGRFCFITFGLKNHPQPLVLPQLGQE
jgi:hypothetical protein